MIFELISSEDFYEDDDLIVVKGMFKSNNSTIVCKDIQIKDKNNDVVVTKTIPFKFI